MGTLFSVSRFGRNPGIHKAESPDWLMRRKQACYARAVAAGMQSQNIANGGSGDNWGESITALTRLNMLAPVIHLMQL